MELTVKISRQNQGGYTVQCVEIPGAISEGETVDEAIENIREAIKLIIDQRREEFRKAAIGASSSQFKLVEIDA